MTERDFYRRYYEYDASRFSRPTGWKAHFMLPKLTLQASSDPFPEDYFMRMDRRYQEYLKARWASDPSIRGRKILRWTRRCKIATKR